ncbi:capsular polysaccharide biosynthesis protein [Mycobacterium sp. JS623]|uniref:YveK family protein n=1 Tax=Mycobacterium sp. JS623 TaxID=212767 RepID=UPI0002A550C1|nr:capsular polysaccharide biosynthesis protein [Mycobacterium sp. JS623]AGB21768.1 capsular polysaccharide biosynthesis protein [Mycobacterium sp. JS623]
MDFIRRYLVLLILATVVGLGIAALYSWSRPEAYRATTRLFFTTNAADLNDVYQGTLAGQQRVKTYEVLASDPKVLREAITRSGQSVSVSTLSKNLHVDVPPGTIIMDIGVDNADPGTAAALANGVSDQLIALVGELERPLGGGPPPVVLSVVERATPDAKASSKLNVVYLGIGAAAGLAAGFVIAFVISAVRSGRERQGKPTPPKPPTSAQGMDDDAVTKVNVASGHG